MLYNFHWIVLVVATIIVINIQDIISITMIDTTTSRGVMDIVSVNFRHDVGDSNNVFLLVVLVVVDDESRVITLINIVSSSRSSSCRSSSSSSR